MKVEINKQQFLYLMDQYRPHNFSLEGLVQLYDYITSIEREEQIDYVLDPNKLCQEWEEGSLNYFCNRYGYCLEDYQEMLDNLQYTYIGYPTTQFDTLAEISGKQIIVKTL